MQAAGDHQMQDEPDVVVEADSDSFAEALEVDDGAAVGGVQGRLDRAQQERAVAPYLCQGFTDDPGFQGLDVDGDVWEFGHGRSRLNAAPGFGLRP